MSNLSQFVGGTIPIGGVQVQMPYGGDLYTAPDGSQWYANVVTAPFAYTSAYSYLPDHFVSPHPLMNGPEANGLWAPMYGNGNNNLNIACNSTATLYCTGTYSGHSTTGYYYYTSTDGVNWTKRTFPNSINYSCIQYTAGKFIAVASSTTTNGIITSTDAVNWTSVTGVSINPTDIVSDGGNNIVILPIQSTSVVVSNDGGTTWASVSLGGNSNYNYNIGNGVITWNAGAGLFILMSSTNGTYFTSPTGATWTIRNAQSTFVAYPQFIASARFASNSTTTVVMGTGGYFATSTDGLTWSNHGYISNTFGSSTTPLQFYYDGTRFVARFTNRCWYSTNGTTWTESKSIGGVTSYISQSSGVLFGMLAGSFGYQTKLIKVSDITSTAKTTIIAPQAAGGVAAVVTAYRIR